jgi:hypothetical protein
VTGRARLGLLLRGRGLDFLTERERERGMRESGRESEREVERERERET